MALWVSNRSKREACNERTVGPQWQVALAGGFVHRIDAGSKPCRHPGNAFFEPLQPCLLGTESLCNFMPPRFCGGIGGPDELDLKQSNLISHLLSFSLT